MGFKNILFQINKKTILKEHKEGRATKNLSDPLNIDPYLPHFPQSYKTEEPMNLASEEKDLGEGPGAGRQMGTMLPMEEDVPVFLNQMLR